jgi:hypothetical protein
MANQHWYGLKVRRGFELLVVQRLRKLNLEVFVPEHTSVTPQEHDWQGSPWAGCIYSRFDLGIRDSVTSIPGVLDIVGTPEPAPFDKELFGMQMKISLQL